MLFLNLLNLYGSFIKYDYESSYMGNVQCGLNK